MTAHVDASGHAVVVAHLDVRDPVVVAEARRWSTGHRATAVAAEEMAGADLTAFVTQALVVGSHAIATTGGAQEAYNLEALVTEVGERTAEASRQATQATDEAVRKATVIIESSTAAARTAINELGAEARRSLSEDVETARKALSTEINRLLGGEHPELLTLLATAQWRSRPRPWTQVVLYPHVIYGYSADRPDVCLLVRRQVLVTVLSRRLLEQSAARGALRRRAV